MIPLVVPVGATAFERVDIPAFLAAFQQLVYLVVYLIVVVTISGVRKYIQRKTGIFDSVSVLPVREQVIRILELVLVAGPFLVWLVWYSEVMFLSSYLLLCYFVEMTPQPQVPVLIQLIIGIVFFVDFVRSVSRVRHSHLKDTTPSRLATEPAVREPAPLVLIVCPYCGAKNEQGIINCRKCGAEI